MKKLILPILFVLTAVPALAQSDDPPRTSSWVGPTSIEGTWRVQITLRNCQTGDPLGNPFPAVATFSRGGTVITADGSQSPALRGPGHGAWRRVTDDLYDAVIEAFLYTAAGAMSGRQRLRQEIRIENRDSFTATVAAEVLNPAGTVVFSGCASSTGVRMN